MEERKKEKKRGAEKILGFGFPHQYGGSQPQRTSVPRNPMLSANLYWDQACTGYISPNLGKTFMHIK